MQKRRAALFLLWVISLVAALVVPLETNTVPAQAQTDWTTPALPVAGFGEHPRLLITRQYIDETLIPRQQNAATWQTLIALINEGSVEENAEWAPDPALRTLTLAWLLTGKPDYASRARALMVKLVNIVESHPAMNGRGGLDGTLFESVGALAVGYDWLYDFLSREDRAALEDTLWRAAKQLRNPVNDTDGIIWQDEQLMAFGNYDPRWLWALTAVGLALYGEQADAESLLDYCRQVLTETVIPALDIQEGGAWAEGPVYGFIAGWAKVQTALVWWTALGENYFDDTSWWYDRLAYDLFLYYPSQAATSSQEWGNSIHDYPSIIGDAERYHGATAYGRAQDLLLRAVFARTSHADWMDWFLRQSPNSIAPWLAVEEFLWRDPVWAGFPPPVFTWFAPYNGHVFMRSNWVNEQGALDDTATYVSFNAGDHLAYHQFFDQGSFTIFHYGADLAVRSGVYSGDGTSDHDANYYVRSIAANTILICDLDEVFDGIRPNNERDVWLNDCGQRSMDPASRTAINTDYLIDNWRIYDTGSITRFGEASGATYIRADITGAYNSTLYTTPGNNPKVSLVMRELVYWRPGMVIVSDRVTTTYPAYTPLIVFHFQAEPLPSGLAFRVPVGNSVLTLQNLLPNSLVSVVTGYEVAGQTVDQSWGEPVNNTFEDQPYGLYRMEIAPGQPDVNHWFLTALDARDADAEPPPEAVLVLGDSVRGVKWGDTQVMFDREPGDEQDITAAVFPIGMDVVSTLVTGLQPGGLYRVEAEGGLATTLAADDNGLLLLENIPVGGVELALADSESESESGGSTSETDDGSAG